MGHRAHVCRVEEDWCTQKSLHQILGILNCLRAAFSGVGVLQNVDQRRRLLSLKKELMMATMLKKNRNLGSCIPWWYPGADTVPLPAGTQHVDWAVSSHQVCEEGRTALVYVLRQAVLKSVDGSVRQLG